MCSLEKAATNSVRAGAMLSHRIELVVPRIFLMGVNVKKNKYNIDF